MRNLKLNFTLGLALVLALIVGMAFAVTPTFAADTILETTVQDITVKPDKNGNDYARIRIQEDRTLQGVAYKADVMVMVFGTAVEDAKKLSAGDRFKAVASIGEYRGNKNYRVVQFIPVSTE